MAISVNAVSSRIKNFGRSIRYFRSDAQEQVVRESPRVRARRSGSESAGCAYMGER